MKAKTVARNVILMNASTLAVQGNPTAGISCLTTSGYIIPPAEFPVVARPTARPLLDWKYVLIRAIAGVKKMPPPIPVRTPCVSMSCQYSFEILMRNMPSTWMTAPTKNVGKKRPASNILPEKAPISRVNQVCTEPIHDMVDGECGIVAV